MRDLSVFIMPSQSKCELKPEMKCNNLVISLINPLWDTYISHFKSSLSASLGFICSQKLNYCTKCTWFCRHLCEHHLWCLTIHQGWPQFSMRDLWGWVGRGAGLQSFWHQNKEEAWKPEDYPITLGKTNHCSNKNLWTKKLAEYICLQKSNPRAHFHGIEPQNLQTAKYMC